MGCNLDYGDEIFWADGVGGFVVVLLRVWNFRGKMGWGGGGGRKWKREGLVRVRRGSW